MSVNVCPDIFWTTEHFVTKFGIVMQHHGPECHMEFCYCCCYLQGQGHSKGSYDQNMILCTIFSELLIPWQPNLVWWYFIISQSVPRKKLDYCRQGQGHSEGSKCKCLSRWYLLNHQAFCFQTWYWDTSLCKSTYNQNMTVSTLSFELLILLLLDWYITISQSVLWRSWIVVFKVKVTAKFQNVKWMFAQMISSEKLNLLLPNLIWWCIIMSHIVFQKDWFAVFKVKVTITDNIIKICLFIYYLNCLFFCN